MDNDRFKDTFEFVDAFSQKIEELGHPRIFGQILGWLLICDPPHQSFPDLMDALEISKASVSNTTRQMLDFGLIEKIQIEGERQSYFRIKEESLIDFVENQMKLTLDLQEITGKGLKLTGHETETGITRLQRVHRFYTFMGRELPGLIDKYKEENDL